MSVLAALLNMFSVMSSNSGFYAYIALAVSIVLSVVLLIGVLTERKIAVIAFMVYMVNYNLFSFLDYLKLSQACVIVLLFATIIYFAVLLISDSQKAADMVSNVPVQSSRGV
jgi:hypothetical protein